MSDLPETLNSTNNYKNLPSTSTTMTPQQNIPIKDTTNEIRNEEIEANELANIANAEEYLEKKKIILLEYEKQMFLDLVHNDGLLVCAKGISYDQVLINILNVYSDAGNLVLIINSSDWEEEFYKKHIDSKHIHEVATTAPERERIYLEGGIQFISTRILVVDLLKNRIPVDLITGIIVLRAHTIIESCQEAFALRLYRQHNKTGFIKAFSSSAEAFTIGYSQIERTMRNLFVKELYLWPRFHAVIQASLKPYESQAIEFHIPMTPKMIQIQTCILEIMNYLVKEIKRINRLVEMDEITVENCVTKKFYKILQAQLDPIWHQLNSQTKLIVADLRVLRNLMICTIYGDPINAYTLIKRYRSTEYAMNNSGWVLLDEAEVLFQVAKDRVFNKDGDFEPEHCAKWKSLNEILRIEIPNDMKKSNIPENEQIKILILCQDSRTCYQLNEYLTQGGERYLFFAALKNELTINKLADSFKNFHQLKTISDTTKASIKNTDTKVDINNIKLKDNLNETLNRKDIDDLTQVLTNSDDNGDCDLFKESYVLTMTQQENATNSTQAVNDEDNDDDTPINASIFETFPELDTLDITSALNSSNSQQPFVCIQTFKSGKSGTKELDKILNELQPLYVIMYHCNITAIRQLEVHEAKLHRPAKDRMRVFFLIHNRTVEEQSYLTSLRREKQAFMLLIDTKKSMVIPSYQDGKTDEAFILLKGHSDDEDENPTNTRHGRGLKDKSQNITPRIIVDMREFRSDLPCLIHRRGIEVVPVTIMIGDYILTPEICVERKSISDLIGSLNSGRLYNQCIQMQRFYSKPILLIEFDQNKPFHLQGKYMLSDDSTGASNKDIVQKLQLLTLHFPNLRLIWSPSPYATSQLFEELKHGKEEPDGTKAAAIGGADSTQFELDQFNTNIYDFLIRLPGVNTKNINKIMKYGGSLKELLKKTEVELGELCNSQADGKLLWNILHVAQRPPSNPTTSNSGFKSTLAGRFRGRGGGRGGRRFT